MSQSHSLLLQSLELKKLKTGDLIQDGDLEAPLKKHLKVLRINPGEEVCFLDGCGSLVETQCDSNRPWTFSVVETSYKAPSTPKIELALSVVKKDAFSLAITQATELGFQNLQLVETERSTIAKKLVESYPSRGKRLAEAAVAQCRSPYLPDISNEVLDLQSWVRNSTQPIVWADEDLSREDLIGFPANLDLSKLKSAPAVSLLIGPEGGWSDAERALLRKQSNIYALGLGSQILRVPTACTAAITLLKSFLS